MSFFERLRKGVADIETEVKKLKESTEDGQHMNEEQVKDNLIKAKSFESEVRQTYSEVSQLLNTIKSSGDPLFESKNRIVSLKQMLFDIEGSSGLKKYGYKPFDGKYSIDSKPDNVFAEIESQEEVDKMVDNHHKSENTINAKLLAEEFTQKAIINEETTPPTVRFAPDMPIVDNRIGSNERTKVETKKPENRNEMVRKKYEKLLAPTPQPQDFGITRRFTLFPQLYDNKFEEKNPKNTPEEPFDTTQTIRFNYGMNNGFQLGSAVDTLTPPHNSVNNTDSFVTVEFTPGLTTKRPKGISRLQNNECNGTNGNNNMNKTSNDSKKEIESKLLSKRTYGQRLPQSILHSVENDKITPEQPIPATDKTKSANFLRTFAPKGSGTPTVPKARIDANFHNQILKHL